jgi:uncharacterized protein YceK
MPKTVLLPTLAACVVVGLSGCGTVYDTCRMSPWGQTFRVYGGVRQDAQEVRDCTARACGPLPDARCWDIVRAGMAAADVPLSAVADTLLLPVTIPHSREAAGREGGATPPREMPSNSLAPATLPTTP